MSSKRKAQEIRDKKNRSLKKHKQPHIHVKYQDDEAVISIPNGELLDEELPTAKMRSERLSFCHPN
ncbi:MAG: DUF4160 domain-containing protein [Nitrospirae bacterium]|nr:DUF4160 domain-containing protein [Nitrospirota bacterium]